KPDPAVYYKTAERMAVLPPHIVVIEDSVSGIRAAKRAGMKCLGIGSHARRAVLCQAGADNVVADFVGLTVDRLDALVNPNGSSADAMQGFGALQDGLT